MESSDQSRRDLFVLLEAALGRETAAKLMAELPPVGWAELATVRDLENLEVRLGARIDQELAGLRASIADLRAEFHRDMAANTRTLVFAQFGAMATTVGLVIAAVRL